ncbi:MAG: DUF134 domain-containing protein [Spirochaetia bacterium]|nr:DUF134 domain-containing protein [Spirochaetia bacterium]
MPRPRKNRKIFGAPPFDLFKPAGIPFNELETITLTLDELEALRLADFEGLYQEEAAQLMEVSRQTFGNIVAMARQKCAEALLQGKMLLIEGGDFEIDYERRRICKGCGRSWRTMQHEDQKGVRCPACDVPGRHRHGNKNNGPRGAKAPDEPLATDKS